MYTEAPHSYELKGEALRDAKERYGGELPDLRHQLAPFQASEAEVGEG